MTESQLRKDLDNRCHEKLTQWLLDSIALYRMADLDEDTASKDIFLNLLLTLSRVSVASGLDADIVGRGVAHTIEKHYEIMRELKMKESN